GLGSSPKLAKLYTDFLPIGEVLPTCEAVLKIFDAHGDRKTKSKARMKFVLEKWGLDQFKAKVAEELAILKESGKKYPPLAAPKPKAYSSGLEMIQNGHPPSGREEAHHRWFRTNLIPQEGGRCAVQVKLILG